MPSDIEGIDQIVEAPSSIQLVFQIQRDWLAEADQAAQETAWKADCCTRFLRSPDFRQRFGMKPGTILMKSARQPPPDVLSDMARIGADVEVGTVSMLGGPPVQIASCAVCQRTGFPNAQMSMTERGLTCPTCFNAWSMQQDRSAGYGGGLSTGLSHWRIARIVIAVVVFGLFGALRACL